MYAIVIVMWLVGQPNSENQFISEARYASLPDCMAAVAVKTTEMFERTLGTPMEYHIGCVMNAEQS